VDDRNGSSTPYVLGWLVAAACAIALVYFGFRPVLAAALVFVLPGLLLLRNLRPRPRPSFENVILSLGTSVALVIVLALVLHRFNALSPSGWWVLLPACCLAAWLLSHRKAGAAPEAPRQESQMAPGEQPPVPGIAFNGYQVASLATVVALVAFAIVTARNGALAHQQFAYTEFWITPFDGRDHHRVVVGVHNKEKQPVSYDLELTLNDKIVARHPNLVLADNEQIVEQMTAPDDGTSPEQRIEARLYRNGSQPILYRRVSLSQQTAGVR
jgi:uncharacterized membrane protein